MNLNVFLFIGLAGAFLMFCGDMTLYYSKDDYILPFCESRMALISFLRKK